MADTPDPAKKKVTIDVQLDDEVALGDYVNMARIYHNQTEFVLDAIFLPPQSTKARVMSRLLLSPVHAKFLLAALNQNIKLYEKKFGTIQPKQPQNPGDGGGSILH